MIKINPTSAEDPGHFKIQVNQIHFLQYWQGGQYAELFIERLIGGKEDIAVDIQKDQKWKIPVNQLMTRDEIQEVYANVHKALTFLKIPHIIEIG